MKKILGAIFVRVLFVATVALCKALLLYHEHYEMRPIPVRVRTRRNRH